MRSKPLNFAQKVASVAVRSARLAASQPEASPTAISAKDETAAASQAPVKKTVAALDRNVLACDQLIDRTKEKIKAAKERPAWQRDDGTIPSLKRQLENLEQRKEILLRLKKKEIAHDDR
jgi:hypothetical protein